MPQLEVSPSHYITISLDEFFEIVDSHRFTETIYLDLSEVQERDPHLYALIQEDKALALRAFHEALKELGAEAEEGLARGEDL